MPLVFDDDSRASGGRLVFDDEVKKKPSTGIGEDLKNYGLTLLSKSGQGVTQVESGIGTVLQDPGGALVSGAMGARAALDRGLTSLIGTVSPEAAIPHTETQRAAQSASELAASRREEFSKNPNETMARLGRGMESDGRERTAAMRQFDIENNPELVRQEQALAAADGAWGTKVGS